MTSQTSPSSRIEVLRRITREMASARDLPALTRSMSAALVEHAGADFSNVMLLLTPGECETCRARGHDRAPNVKALHSHSTAGDFFAEPEAFHIMPLDGPNMPAIMARTRKAWMSNDLERDLTESPDRDGLLCMGFVAAGGHPLMFRGELLGVLGMLRKRPFEYEAFELLSIFADQAAIALKSAHLFRQLDRHRAQLEIENEYLRSEIVDERGTGSIVGASTALKQVLKQVKQVAPVETTVLLTGETGTGKELIARAIHQGSARHDRAMIKINCGAIPQGVVESELFGHERGAFTGAVQKRIGRFELADKGTLFMDEVGELPLETQVKLLRVLQEQELERVGGSRPINVDVRLVTATNRDLQREVSEGRFRSDLYYRLNVFPIHVPPLRERPADIEPLVRHFVGHFRRKLAKPIRGVSPESMERLQRYAWPGNIRELQNVLERACVLATTPMVDVFDPGAREGDSTDDDGILTLDESERLHLRRALDAAQGRIHGPGGAAELLGINGSTLRSRMQKLGISKHVS